MTKSPAALGYRMPAEWAPHRATWIAWPHEKADWPGRFPPIPWVYGEIVRVLSRNEQVGILFQDGQEERRARRILGKIGVDPGRVEAVRLRTDRVWLRDSGPIFVRTPSGRRMATCWTFNGWAKYPNHLKDQRVARGIARSLGVPAYPVWSGGRPVVMEGGAIDVDGQGTLLATEECLLSDVQARNPGLGRSALEKIFAEALGIRKVVWLGEGLVGDDTHGHIDDLARFVAPGTVLLCEEKNPKDENYRRLKENRDRLASAKLEVVPLPMPQPIVFDGQRVPASYANFYLANGTVLVPTFNDPNDRKALGQIADCFPGREVVGIHCVEMIWGLGTLHCATQQEPA